MNYAFEDELRKNQRKSAFITAIIVTLLLLLCWFWVIKSDTIPPEDENPYETVATIDFGNMRQGSKNINNFKDPTPNPDPNADKSTPQPTTPTRVREEPVISSIQDAPIETPPPTPRKPTPTPPKPAEPKPETKPTPSSGGSNHGNSNNQTGNAGNPRAQVLDPKGLFSFGSGDKGLGNRKLLYKIYPEYGVQEEGIMTFQLIIAPSGDVIDVRVKRQGGQAQLRNNVEQALRKWKFSRISEKKNQTVEITWTFKLR